MKTKLRKFGAGLMALALAFAGAGAVQAADTVAKIGGTGYETLQAAVDAARDLTGDVTIELQSDVTGYAVVLQKAGLNLVIDGTGHKMKGQIVIDGEGRSKGTETLTIVNVNFEDDKSNFLVMGGSATDAFVYIPNPKGLPAPYYRNSYNYAHNVTVANCTFTGTSSGLDVVAIKSTSGATQYNLKVVDVTGSHLHSLAQLTGTQGSTFVKCTVTDSDSFINIDGGDSYVHRVTDCTFVSSVSDGYAIREKGNSSAEIILEGNNFKANKAFQLGKNDTPSGVIKVCSGNYDGDIAVNMTAGAAATYEISGGTFSVEPPEAYLVEGYSAKKNGDVWTVGVEITDETIVTTKPQESKVEIPAEVEIAPAVQQKIQQTTKVEGVKLSATETAQKPAGIVAVVDAAKKNTEFAEAVAAAPEVSVKVEVEVKPTEFDNTDNEVAFKLTPKATVTVGEGEGKKEQVVPVTNDMIDQNQKIAVSIYTGFKPAVITHDDENGSRIETFTGEEQIAYDEATGVATVLISHFSTVSAFGDAAKAPAAKVYVAKVGDTSYETLQEAINAAADGATITLLKDCAASDITSFAGKTELTFEGGTPGRAIIFQSPISGPCGGITTLNFRNLTINGFAKFGLNYYRGWQITNENYEDCTIQNCIDTYSTNCTLKNCLVSYDGNDYALWDYACKNLVLDSCTFDVAGKAVKIYNEGTVCDFNVYSTNCTFKTSETKKSVFQLDVGHFTNVAAVKIAVDESCTTEGYTEGVEGGDPWIYSENDTSEFDSESKGQFAIGTDIVRDETGKVTGGTFTRISAGLVAEGFVPEVDSETGKIGVVPDPITGSGTEADPYVISDLKGLKAFRDRVNAGNTYNGKFVKLGSDIDLASVENWEPIGTEAHPFMGSFDGDNKTISNLKINATTQYQGLFGYVKAISTEGPYPTLKNLTLENVDVKTTAGYAGGFAGKVYCCTVENIVVKGSVNAGKVYNHSWVGGVMGHSYGTARNCRFEGSVVGYGSVGGISGASGDTKFYDCAVNGDISGNYWVGGIAGNGQEGTSCTRCTVKGTISADRNYYGGTGGIAGAAGMYSSCTFEDNYFDGVVKIGDTEIGNPVIGAVNAGADVAATVKIEGNSWNTEKIPNDVTVAVIGMDMPGLADNTTEEQARAVAQRTEDRNANLVGSVKDLEYVGSGAVEIAAGSAITEMTPEQIKAKVVESDPTKTVEIVDGKVVVTVNIAQIVETGVMYPTLQTALDAAGANETVVLLADVTSAMNEAFTVAAGKLITLDLNGKVLSGGNDKKTGFAYLTNCGTLTLKDSSTEGAGKITSKTYPDTGNCPGFHTVLNKGTFVMESGTIEEASEKVGGGNNLKWAFRNEASQNQKVSATIKGGLIVGNYNAISDYVHDDSSECTLNVEGGLIKSTGRFSVVTLQSAFASKPKFHINVSGGEFIVENKINTNTDGNAIFYCDGQANANADFTGCFKITGGRFNTFNTPMIAEFTADAGTPTPDTKFMTAGLSKCVIPQESIAEGYVCVANEDAETTAEGYLWKVVPQQLTPTVDDDAEKPTYDPSVPDEKKEAEQTKEAIKEQTDNVKDTLTSPVITTFTETNVEKPLFETSGALKDGVKEALCGAVNGMSELSDEEKDAVRSAIDGSSDSNSFGRVQIDLKEMAVGVKMETSEEVVATLNKVSYDVKPILVTEVTITTGTETKTKTVKTEITKELLAGSKVRFRLAVGKEFDGQAQVIHYSDAQKEHKVEDYYTAVRGEGNSKYVEIESDEFSPFDVLNANAVQLVCKVGDNMYATIGDAIADSDDDYDTTIELLKDIDPAVVVSDLGKRVIDRKGKAFQAGQVQLQPGDDNQVVTGADGTIYIALPAVDVPVGDNKFVKVRGYEFPSDVAEEQKGAYLAEKLEGASLARWQTFVMGVDETAKVVPQIVGAAEGSSTVVIKADFPALNPPTRCGVKTVFRLMQAIGTPTGYSQYGADSDVPHFQVDVKEIAEKTFWKIQTSFKSTEVAE